MIVMNCTFESSESPAMNTIALATSCTSMRGSTIICPLAWTIPLAMRSVISVAALPMSICPQAMSNGRPSREMHLVRPVMACLVEV